MPENPIGIIYTTEQASQQFGNVQNSVQISSADLKSFAEQTDKYLMFKIISGVLYILGDGRTIITPNESSVDPEEVFAVYSKSKVNELIDTGGEGTTIVEKRNEVFSLTNGQSTLETSEWCPPVCS